MDRWEGQRDLLAAFAGAQHPYAIMFTTISGADLYGFPSDDGDYDLRGGHILPLRTFSRATLNAGGWDRTAGLTIEVLDRNRQPEMDYVSHDIGKVLRLALKANGYILEQILSPLVVTTSDEHNELRHLARRLVTRRIFHHYSGFFTNQERLYDSQGTKRIKGLLYQYRVALTGIHVLRSGEIEANLLRLNAEFKSSLVAELIAMKVAGEHRTLMDDAPYRREIESLRPQLVDAFERSALPFEIEETAHRDVEDFLWRVRSSLLQ